MKTAERTQIARPDQIPPRLVDLVILIDTSDSMADEAVLLSRLLGDTIQAVQKSCPSDLRVLWFGIEGIWEETQFSLSYRAYMRDIGIPETALVGKPHGSLPHQGAREDGAAAIIDIAHHFDWRSHAARIILFLGDEALKGGNPYSQADVIAANRAISTAQTNGVQVFTYLGTKTESMTDEEQAKTRADYVRLATVTGGQFYETPAANIQQFQIALTELVCTAGGFNDVDLPVVQPCFALYWGDSPADHLETNDRETIHIVAWNPYTNVIFKDVRITLSALTREGKAIPLLPDETPAVFISPSSLICFGDLPPCDLFFPRRRIKSVRKVTLVSRGAEPGCYLFSFDYCYTEKLLFNGQDLHPIELQSS